MEKITFTYQRWFLKISCSAIGLPVAMIIQYIVAESSGLEYANFWYILICVVIMFAWLYIYYKFTQRHNMFERTGFCLIKNGTMYIQKQNKAYELKNIKWLRGTIVSIYGIAKSGMLIIQSGKKKIVLVSSQATSVNSFANCELRCLFETILKYNPELIKNNDIDYWYESNE